MPSPLRKTSRYCDIDVVRWRGGRYRQVGLAIAVEVGGHDPPRQGAGGIGRSSGEGAIASIGEHDHRGVHHVHHGQVDVTIAIKVSRSQPRSARTSRVQHGGGEAAIAPIEQHRHRASRKSSALSSSLLSGLVSLRLASDDQGSVFVSVAGGAVISHRRDHHVRAYSGDLLAVFGGRRFSGEPQDCCLWCLPAVVCGDTLRQRAGTGGCRPA